MEVLDCVLSEGGYKITVRSYNSILTGLGYRLGNYIREPKDAPGILRRHSTDK